MGENWSIGAGYIAPLLVVFDIGLSKKSFDGATIIQCQPPIDAFIFGFGLDSFRFRSRHSSRPCFCNAGASRSRRILVSRLYLARTWRENKIKRKKKRPSKTNINVGKEKKRKREEKTVVFLSLQRARITTQLLSAHIHSEVGGW